MPKRGASERYALGEEQRDVLLSVCQSLEDKVLIKLYVYAGLRVSEVAHLNRDWVANTIAGLEIRIPESELCDCKDCAKRKDQGLWQPKTRASIRVIPVTTPLLADLQEFMKLSPEGFRKTRQSLWWRTKQLGKAAKILQRGRADNTTFPHALRATAASYFAAKGMSAVGLCYIMGWNDIRMGQHYISVALAKQEAHKQLRQILG